MSTSSCTDPHEPYQLPAFAPGHFGDNSASLMNMIKISVASPIDTAALQTEGVSYATSTLAFTLIPGIVVAVLVLLCWLPCWISRCCAHRCCKPSAKGPSKRSTLGCTCCFAFAYVACLATGIVGWLAMPNSSVAAHWSLCQSNQKFLQGATYFDQLSGNLTLLYDVTLATDAALSNVSSGLSCAGTWATDTCNQVDAVQSQIVTLGTLIPDTTDPTYTTLKTYVDVAAGYCVMIRQELLPPLDDIQAIIDDTSVLLTDNGVYFKDVGEILSSISETLRSLVNRLTDVADFVNEYGTPAMAAAGALLFVGPVAFHTLAALGLICVARSENRAAGCANGCGVQLLGCAWVWDTLACFGYFLLGSLFLTIGAVVYDLCFALQHLPTSFVASFNNSAACGTIPAVVPAPPDLSDPGTTCAFVEQIFQTCWNGKNLILMLLEMLGITVDWDAIDTALADAIAEVSAYNPANFTATVASLSGELATFESSISGLSSVDFGTADAQIDAWLGVTTSTAGLAVTSSTTLAGCLLVLSAALQMCYDTLVYALDVLRSFIHNIDTWGDCSWISELWVAVTNLAVLAVESPIVLASVGFLLTACFMALIFIPSSIAMQVVYGGVGSQPGCPRRCRSKACCAEAYSNKVTPRNQVV